MHILLISTYFEPDQGAASIILTRLAKKLQGRGHQLTVLTTLPHYPEGRIAEGYRGKLVMVEDRDGMRVIQTWLWATASRRISRKFIAQVSFMFSASLRGLTIPRPDVVLIEAQPIFTNLAGVFLSRIKRVPYVLDVSDLWPDHLLSVGIVTQEHPVYRIARWLVDTTYRGASGITALTPFLAETIQRYIGATDKIRVIYSGVDLTRFRPGLDTAAFRQKYELGDGRLVTFIGTFGTAYDMELMLEAARPFTDREDVKFVFMGRGSQNDVFRQRLGRGDLPNVRWIEWVDHAEIPYAWASSYATFWALHKHDLHRGAIATKLYEAMGSGVPVAVALEGLVADILKQSGGGIAVPFGDMDGLVNAIGRLLDEPNLREQCSRAARAYAEQHFDYEKSVAAYEEMLMKTARTR
jgi:glycosyltransferase involved in cell wall biosynthesis